MKNNIVKDAIALFMITLIAGLLLGTVYEVTKVPIAQAEFDTKQEAYKKVFPSAATFGEDVSLNEACKSKEIFTKDKSITGVFIEEVLVALDKGKNEIGYVMTTGSKEGYGGAITMSIGVDKQGKITGLEVLSMSETAGLGANCTTDEFKTQFKDIKDSKVVYTKEGKSKENEIDALSGATITTKAVTNAVNNALAFIYANGTVEQ